MNTISTSEVASVLTISSEIVVGLVTMDPSRDLSSNVRLGYSGGRLRRWLVLHRSSSHRLYLAGGGL
ncbi:hypothetical protein L1987_47310 [Smallanthus sonchifolius]|uniref:Uncharacterized protein n=1 Tax=Smallanthus sonchifolius TaxID=185202 RepID=A0ACB9G295_9ASTR|nr:hypothetical protein L1987_47310 [Smallanthus sonchifolius]